MTHRKLAEPRPRRQPSPEALAALELGRVESRGRYAKLLPWIFGAAIVQGVCAIVRRDQRLDDSATRVDYTSFVTTLVRIGCGMFISWLALRSRAPSVKAT